MPEKTQTKESHTRYHPLFHFFFLPVLLVLLLAAIYRIIRYPGIDSFLHVLLVLAVAAAGFIGRGSALKVQDRVIRLEERLRLSMLLPARLQGRIPELSERQLIALRFASDQELPTLAERALAERWEPKSIKAAIQNWRPDYWRV